MSTSLCLSRSPGRKRIMQEGKVSGTVVKAKFMGRDHLQRVVDVRRGGLDTRTALISSGRNIFFGRGQKTRECVRGGGGCRSQRENFRVFCYLHDGGTFVAQCWWLHNMEEKLVDIRCGGPDPSEEICECFRLEVRGVWSAWQRASQRSSLFCF